MRKLLFCIPFLFALMSCIPSPQGAEGLTVASWNTWLMFDAEDDGTEFPPFTGDNSRAYERRLELTAEVLEALDADILVLQEIESEEVLRDLIDAGLGHCGFRWYGIAGNGSPISVGFLSKIEPGETHVHSSNGFRPFLDVTFNIGHDELRVFMLHAKSRLGGGEHDRRATYEHIMWLARRHEGPVMIAGDFNEDPRTGPSFLDRRYGPSVLPVTGFPELTGRNLFYSEVLSDPEAVTFAYEGEWYAYDHILMNDLFFDGAGLEHVSTKVWRKEHMLDEEGFPKRFTHEDWTGWSDHLPIVTRLRYH